MRLALIAVLLTLASLALLVWPDEAMIPEQDQAGIVELLRWDAYGCTTDTDCERMQSWIFARYHFEEN